MDSKMLFLAGSSSTSDRRKRMPALPAGGPFLRMVAWFLQRLGQDARAGVPVRVYYKFDSGRWRNRNTRQLHKVYRCR